MCIVLISVYAICIQIFVGHVLNCEIENESPACDEANPNEQRLNPTDQPMFVDYTQTDGSRELSDATLQSQGSRDLPPFNSLSLPNFRWGDLDGEAFTSVLNRAYTYDVEAQLI